MNPLEWTRVIGDKLGSLGAVVSAMGCALCFPAIATLGAALGLGFLSRWEWTFVDTLLPLFGALVLIINALGWFSHRQWGRSLVGMLGPTLLLLSLHPWFTYAWSSYVTYGALGLMVAVSIRDLISPGRRHCRPDGCEP